MPPSPNRLAPIPIFLALALFTSIALALYFDIDSRFLGSESRQARVNRYATMDPTIEDAAAGKGLFIRFDHQNTTDAQWGYVPQAIYFRAVYLLYPQPVLIDDPSAPIDDLPDVVKSRFNPSDAWLANHGIGSVITFDRSTGVVQTTVRTLSPTTQP